MFHKKVFVWEDMKQGRYDMSFPYGRDICEQECMGYYLLYKTDSFATQDK